jgi:hypothetical protein
MINAKNDMERQLMGSGDAVMCTLTNSATVDKVDGVLTVNATNFDTKFEGGFFPTQFLRKGQVVDICLAASPGTAESNFTALTVVGWDTFSVRLQEAGDTSGTDTLAAAAHVITPYKAYGQINATDTIVTTGTGCLEINGMKNLVDNGVLHGIWGRDDAKADSTKRPDFMKSYQEDLSGTGELTEDKLLIYLMNMQYQFQADPNLLLVSPKAVLEYFTEFESNRRFNTFDSLEIVGGYKGMGIQLGTKKLMLTSVGSMPNDHAYMINTGDFAFATMTNGYEWVNQGGGQVMTQKEGSDGKFATAVNYLNFICNDPYKQMKITGIQNGTYADGA